MKNDQEQRLLETPAGLGPYLVLAAAASTAAWLVSASTLGPTAGLLLSAPVAAWLGCLASMADAERKVEAATGGTGK